MSLKNSGLTAAQEFCLKENGCDGNGYDSLQGRLCESVEVVGADLLATTIDTVRQAMKHGQDETLSVLDLSDVVHKYLWWTRHLPHVQPYYAVKVNDDPAVLNTLSIMGANFDCATKEEIEAVRRVGVSTDRIIFANTVKFRSHILHAADIGLHLMTFDNENELYKIKSTCPNARLVLRIEPFECEEIQWKLHDKFGCHYREGAPRLLRLARTLDLSVVGVSFHVGSGCKAAEAYTESIRYARHVFDVAATQGMTLHLVDIGGGFFGGPQSYQFLSKMSGPIEDALLQNFPPESGVKYIAEPGRYFVESALTIATCVIGKRVVPSSVGRPKEVTADFTEDGSLKTNLGKKDSGNGHFDYYLSDGVYGCMRDLPALEKISIVTYPMTLPTAPVYNSTLWGPTCDSVDCLQTLLPLAELEQGDWIIFRHMGAYTTVFRSGFNGMTKPRLRRILRKDEGPLNEAVLPRS